MSAMPNRPDDLDRTLRGVAATGARRPVRRVCYVARTNRELAAADLEQTSAGLEASAAEVMARRADVARRRDARCDVECPYTHPSGATLH